MGLLLEQHEIEQLTLGTVTKQSGSPVTATTAGSSITQSFTVASATDRVLVVFVHLETAADTVSSITYGGTNLQKVASIQGTSFTEAQCWIMINPPTGTANVVVTFNVAGDNACGIYQLNDVDQTFPLGQVEFKSASADFASLNIPGTDTDCFVIGGLSIDSTARAHTPDDETEEYDIEVSVGTVTAVGVSETGKSPNTVLTSTWSGSTEYSLIGISVRPAVSAGGIFVDLTAVTEADTLVSLVKQKFATIGQASETDSAQARNAQHLIPHGFVSETDTTQARTLFKRKTFTPVNEVDTLNSLSTRKLKTVSFVSETDAAQAVLRSKRVSVLNSAEVDASQARTIDKIVVLIPATETDAAQAISFTQGSGGETQFITVAQATESDLAQALALDKLVTLSNSSEVDSALVRTLFKRVTLGTASETDAVQLVTQLKRVTAVAATESDSIVAVTKRKLVTLPIALETDSVQSISFTKTIYKTVTPALEFDTAVAVSIQGQEVTIVYRLRGPIVIGRF